MNLRTWEVLPLAQKRAAVRDAASRCQSVDSGDVEKILQSMVFLDQFIAESHRIKGVRSHYSARVIVEVLRHHSIYKDADKQYKINNNITPKMARITMAIFPELNGLFKQRERANYV